jgi:branched-chain amino acid transport system ATP-binding protein
VPEDRAIFPELTVRENLLLGQKRGRRRRAGRWTTCSGCFRSSGSAPTRRRRAVGGEQQMLTICRTLMGDPDLIMVDEPTEGLAPRWSRACASCSRRSPARGIAILLIEQKLTIALEISHRLYVMGHGRIVFEGSADALRAARDPARVARGVSAAG